MRRKSAAVAAAVMTTSAAKRAEMIERAARIIDQNAFNARNPAEQTTRRQRIAMRKAADVLALALSAQDELVEALADAHRDLKKLIEVFDTLDVNFHKQLDPDIARRDALLARHGRQTE
jgi:hypothetical protein